MVTLVTNTTENKDCSDLWVNFTCISSEANPPVYNYLVSGGEDGFSFSQSGTWVKKITRGGKVVYNCVAYQLMENTTSTNNVTLTVNGTFIFVCYLTVKTSLSGKQYKKSSFLHSLGVSTKHLFCQFLF